LGHTNFLLNLGFLCRKHKFSLNLVWISGCRKICLRKTHPQKICFRKIRPSKIFSRKICSQGKFIPKTNYHYWMYHVGKIERQWCWYWHEFSCNLNFDLKITILWFSAFWSRFEQFYAWHSSVDDVSWSTMWVPFQCPIPFYTHLSTDSSRGYFSKESLIGASTTLTVVN
jgi:hypothetical protein